MCRGKGGETNTTNTIVAMCCFSYSCCSEEGGGEVLGGILLQTMPVPCTGFGGTLSVVPGLALPNRWYHGALSVVPLRPNLIDSTLRPFSLRHWFAPCLIDSAVGLIDLCALSVVPARPNLIDSTLRGDRCDGA